MAVHELGPARPAGTRRGPGRRAGPAAGHHRRPGAGLPDPDPAVAGADPGRGAGRSPCDAARNADLGAVGLRFRDVWLVSNVSVALLLLLTGVNVPAAELPTGMRVAGQFLPITHAAEAARRHASLDTL